MRECVDNAYAGISARPPPNLLSSTKTARKTGLIRAVCAQSPAHAPLGPKDAKAETKCDRLPLAPKALSARRRPFLLLILLLHRLLLLRVAEIGLPRIQICVW